MGETSEMGQLQQKNCGQVRTSGSSKQELKPDVQLKKDGEGV